MMVLMQLIRSNFLQVLHQFKVKASFFWLGCNVTRTPQVAQAVAAAGHWLGIHGFDHRSFPRLTGQEFHQTLDQTQQVIAEVCDLTLDRIRDVRPPEWLIHP